MEKQKIIIGSRGSDLAIWQANHVKDTLEKKLKIDCSIKIIKTSGDVFLEKSLQQSTDKGFFTKEIEEELLAQKIDLAVHSLKDLPTFMPQGLHLSAVSARAAVADLLLVHADALPKDFHKKKDSLPLKAAAVVGATSLRRQSLLHKFLPSAQTKLLRGNVPGRIRKLREKQYDAIILAEAGLQRLQLDIRDLHVFRLNPSLWIPAPAQGILGLQCRSQDKFITQATQSIHCVFSSEAAFIERELLRRFEGGCHSAFGAWAQINQDAQDNKKISLMLGHENQDGLWKSVQVFAADSTACIEKAYTAMQALLQNKTEEKENAASWLWQDFLSQST